MELRLDRFIMVREKREIWPILLKFGVALALIFAGFLYSRIRTRRVIPKLPPRDCGGEAHSEGQRTGLSDRSGEAHFEGQRTELSDRGSGAHSEGQRTGISFKFVY
ncbi:hypothetical protein EUGRSUZ_C01652 [Eucalyptus grandis]|uniref:Uncharacterized protein n=2 Tax=Eucalyptus grandis TaxID=71139 RepID=A0A059CPX8_EUCGR|nr:hypothetical protein EUGRSUZ_C01652 [Eucalyptus grandis]